MSKQSEILRAEALEKLQSLLKPGSEVLIVLRHVAKSGMSRALSLFVVDDGQLVSITWHASKVLGERIVEKNGYWALHVTGCGMDMGFQTVYSLGRILFPGGFGIASRDGRRPSSREHADQMRANGYEFFGRNGDRSGWDTDGGYALKHRWL